MRCARATSRCARSCATPARATRLAAWGVELVTGDVTDPASLRAACAGRGHGRPPRRDHQGLARGLRARHGAGHAQSRRGGAGRRRPPLRARERARPRRAVEGRGAVLRREVGDGARREGVRPRPRDLPAELRLRPRRRRAADVRAPRALRAGHADRRAGHAAAAADLGRGPRGVLRARGRRSRMAASRDVRARRPGRGDVERVLGAPEARRSACGGRRSTCRSA